MAFPRIHKEIRRLAIETVWDVPTARDIARKAGIRSVAGTSSVADIWGTFSQVNDTSFGYISDYAAGVAAYYFPDDTERMSRYGDMSGYSESRLLVTVTQAGLAGSSMGMASDQITFAESIQLPLDEVGLHVSDWAGMTLTQANVLARWIVGNPTMAAGSFGVGLMQWQVR